MISWTTITVWTVSAVLAAGIGWSRYEKKKTRDKLVRELAAMDSDRREKILSPPQSQSRHRAPRAANETLSLKQS